VANVSIHVEQMGKRYRLGARQQAYRTLRESLSDAVRAPVRGLARVFRGQKQLSEARDMWALKDVSFDVQQGEAIGVIGRNGAGKSTLLKILSRITHPTEGFADLSGRVGSLLEVGTGFHPELSGRENIFLNGAILGMQKREIVRRFDEIVAFAEVERFIDTAVKHYSSGMYLRLAFAVAAHLEPEILLVDEVLAVGDAEFQKKCLGKMESVAGEGRTVLFVSHNMAAVQRLCSRVVFLQNGTVAQVGRVGEVIPHYLRAGLTQQGERQWEAAEAPGDKIARLRAVRARRSGGDVSAEYKVTEGIDLEVEFDVLEPGHKLNMGIHVHDANGTLLFVAGDFQDPRWQDRERPLGRHLSRCHIPANLLNEGRYSVLAGVSTFPVQNHAVERDAISFRVDDDMTSTGARGSWPREWPGGAVRPLFTWSFAHEVTP
jgi:lipopolysaccharide transport system ATP-binding protein